MIDKLHNWFETTALYRWIDRWFVAKVNVSYAELINAHPEVGEERYSCGVCTAVRTFVIASVFWFIVGLLAWALILG